MGEFVRLEVSDGIGTIRLDRPPMNALNEQMQDELAEIATEASAREDISAVVIYGGPKVFAAGADIKEMKTRSYAYMSVRAHRLQASFVAVAKIPKPVVAAITGYALGGGHELALCADFRVAGDNVKVGQPEILLGIIPGAGGTQRLTRLIGPAKAKDLVFSGRFVAADEALSLGLLDKIVAPDDVYEAAVAMVRPYVGAASLALRAAKAAIDGGIEVDLTSGLALESQLFATTFATQDRTAGMESFVENGPGKATFTGQ
ncbi:enoyl-CoA hydratase-related protein [Fodinicola feengrottensis]|uniref:Enoyl-CoA hydratase-related protein n=1 Tax=Fodinicola feengrottensis TaxID=435914 RepID=A0ABN2FT25_9ACTN